MLITVVLTGTELVYFEGTLYIAKQVPYRCCHMHSVHCDCYRHRVVALHIATTAPLRGGDNNHYEHYAYGSSDMVLASLYSVPLK